MNKINFLLGVTVGITAMLVIPPAVPTSHLVKASSCSSSASAGGAPNRLFAGQALMRPPVRAADQGCSSGSVAVGGTNGGTGCFAANNGQGQLAQKSLVGGSQQSCFASNQAQARLAK